MKKQTFLLLAAASLLTCSANASITNAWWQADGDGAIACDSWTWDATSQASLLMYGRQYGLPSQVGPGVAAHMLGWAQTTDELDPTLFLGSSVDNDTGGVWSGYKVNVIMSQAFTFSGTPGVSNPDSTWNLAGIVAPTLQMSGPYAGKYEGTIDYAGGTPVGIGDELDFSYSIHFLGSTSYAFTQEMIPIFSEVPEPSTIVLAGMGGLALALRLRRNSRKA